MTCREFELALAREESGAAIEAHLAGCTACRELAEEMRANSEALLAFSIEQLPPLRGADPLVRGRRPRRPLSASYWAVAAAAMLLLTFGATRMLRVQTIPPPQVRVAVAAPTMDIPAPDIPPPLPAVKRRTHKPAPALMVKMLTSDPDVVIYWSIETKEGTE